MRPSVYIGVSSDLTTTQIDTHALQARELIKEKVMHATTVAFLSTALIACIPDAPSRYPVDGGTTTTAKCDDMQTVTQDLTVDSADAPDAVPASGCWTLAGKLTIRGSSVTSLSMLGDLRGANEIALQNTMLTSFDTKSGLDVSGPINVTNNTKLTDISKLHAATVATLVTIDTNPALTSIDGVFDDLIQVTNTVTIRNNAALTSVSFPNLNIVGNTTVGQSLLITNNAVLDNIQLPAYGLPNRLEISNNPKLSSIGDIPATQIVSDLVIRNNPTLATLPAFASLARVGGDVTISNNQTLSSLGQFPQLRTVLGTLTIDTNAVLGTIDGFSKTAGMQIGTLSITSNPVLTDLGYLSHGSIPSVTITGNTTLPNCKAREVGVCAGNGSYTASGNKSQNNCTSWCGR
jgi:hypothetical protein